MSLKDQITTDSSSIFLNTDEFAVECTYTKEDSTALTVNCIIESLVNQSLDPVRTGGQFKDKSIFHTSLNFVPQIYDTITDPDGVIWNVDNGAVQIAGMWKIPVYKNQKVGSYR